jgi:hypothetical protein
MAPPKEKLRILTFPQRIDGKQLELNVLLLPTQTQLNANLGPFASQLNPGTFVDLPTFITADLELRIMTIKGLSTYPFSNEAFLIDEGSKSDSFPTKLAFPKNLPILYEGLAGQFEIDPVGAGAGDPLHNKDGIRKYLPLSYRAAFNFTNPRTEFAKIDDSYQCAIKCPPEIDPAFGNSANKIPWGRVIGFCLRQPLLAEKIGLLHKFPLTLPSADYFAEGGWVYFELAESSYAGFGINDAKTELKQYAARIPAIERPRQLFGALLFPVVPGPFQPNGQFDILKIEAADYDDGYAKIVHAFQPVSANLLAEEPDGIHVQRDAGIRLGWDDEQILIWQNRQLLEDPTTPNQRIDAPLGVFSYRIDVREKTAAGSDWASLVEVRNKDSLMLAGETIAAAQTGLETGVQVFPSKINADPKTTFWLPSFFTQWYGASLVLPDDKAAQLDESGALANPGSYSDANIEARPQQKGGLYEPLLPREPELKYGKQYEFRVRLADLTGGGPRVDEGELNDAPATSAFISFKRFVAPKQLSVTPVTFVPDPKSQTNVVYPDTSFTISRPRLGYPALLFTELDTADAFKKLRADKEFLHKDKIIGIETIKEQREVSFFDPDVDKFMVLVEVKSLLMDNAESRNGREAYLPLYRTFRTFAADPETPFNLELEYRDANVIDFGNVTDLGDLNLSQADIDDNAELVLPTSRDIRITLLPVCSDKPVLPAYFGFAETEFKKEFVRTGEPTQFFVRQDAVRETDFFRHDLESRQLRGIYLQPDPPPVNNPLTIVKETVAGKQLQQSPFIQRLASQLDVDFNGLSLIGKPGERIQFGCSSRIRHTLAPDNSSLTFATKGDLMNHWLCVLSFEIDRDWTWDGLGEAGIEIARLTRFTGESGTRETSVVGYVELRKTISRVATTSPDRSYTRVVFVDAVEPKKDLTKPATLTQPFPNTIDVRYRLRPDFIPSVAAREEGVQTERRDLILPVTTVPAQVPKVAAVGFALSPYQRNKDYSETAVRQRYLWFEFEEPIADPNDTYFARVLAYAPDPLLTFANVDQLFVKQEDPPLAIDPELIRVITHDHGNDNAGIDAMQEMTAEIGNPGQPLIMVSPVHYLLPLPPGLHNESNELFGFYTYELRVGHSDRIWSTAQGRFGHPKRVNGAQHPAPPLKCLVDRTPAGITVTAQYATSVFNGKNVTSKPPNTEIWCMLYAQLRQADGKDNRNILLTEERLDYVLPDPEPKYTQSTKLKLANAQLVNLDAPSTATQTWPESEIQTILSRFSLSPDTSLSVLAVEMMPRYDRFILHGPSTKGQHIFPLSQDLGQYRILRTSRLVSAPAVC